MLDFDLLTERLAVGGGIWTRENFADLQRAGFTHIINVQSEFDDRALGGADDPSTSLPSTGSGSSLRSDRASHDPVVLDLGTDDDLQPKPAELFFRGIRFALEALAQPRAKVLVHCASGIHRGPMVALAILRALGYARADALRLLQARRPQAEFPDVYLDSVEAFVAEWESR